MIARRPDQAHNPETDEELETKVMVNIARHGKKTADPEKSNAEQLLTPEGQIQAVEKGKELKPQPEVSVAMGSPRKRTQETTGHIMLAESEQIDPNASLEEMEEVIAKELKVGKKIIEDKRLDFNLDGPEGKESFKAFKEGKYLDFLINKSNQRAKELGDKESSTYLRLAGNIAELIARYAKIGDNFNKVAKKTEKYKKFGNQMERYLGSHQGVAEMFVAKVLEDTKGKEARDEFIDSIGANGFQETEGPDFEIINKGSEQTIKMSYPLDGKRGSIEIDKQILENIIDQRDKFNESIE